MINNRRHKRIDKIINLFYSLADELPQKWDMSIAENIGTGGLRFIGPFDLKLKDKVFNLRIKLPQLAPALLEVEAMVVDVKQRLNGDQADIRVKFINLSAINKEHLSVLEKMIESQEIKNAKNDGKKI